MKTFKETSIGAETIISIYQNNIKRKQFFFKIQGRTFLDFEKF